MLVLGITGFDPNRDIRSGISSPYQNTQLSRYDASSRVQGRDMKASRSAGRPKGDRQHASFSRF